MLEKEIFASPSQPLTSNDVPKARESTQIESLSFPLPEAKDAEYRHINASGLSYQVDHIYRRIKVHGAVESDQMPLEASVVMAETLDEIRKQLGVKFPQDQ